MDGALPHADRDHARLAPSAAHRWLVCPGSVALSETIPFGDKTSAHAEEGSAAHELAERALTSGKDAIDFFGQPVGSGFTVDKEMVENVQAYLDLVRSREGDFRRYEAKLDLSDVIPAGFGTVDALTINRATGVMHIDDLKYGTGVKVFAEKNPQLMIYALGACQLDVAYFSVETIRLCICQPRLDHVDEWEISRDDLLTWARETLSPAVQDVFAEHPIFVPTESGCRWCPAGAICGARGRQMLENAGREFEGIFSDDPATDPLSADMLDAEGLARILPHAKAIRDWLSAVEKHAFEEHRAGRRIPGFKLVAGRSNRRWSDEEGATRALTRALGAKNAFTKTLLSPAQAEAALGKEKGRKFTDKYAVKPEGAPTLAPESDPRPDITPDPNIAFADLVDEATGNGKGD